MKTLRLVPADNINVIDLENVSGFALEGETLLVVFGDGTTRNYPLRHLGSYHSQVDDYEPVREEPMRLIVSLKNNLNKEVFDNVSYFEPEGETLLIVFFDGYTINIPLRHVWYYSSHVEYHKIKLSGEEE